MIPIASRRLAPAALLASFALMAPWAAAQQIPTVAEAVPPPDATWTADAEVAVERTVTDATLGAGQGVYLRDGMVYAYGDVFDGRPRVGVIREYDRDLKPTGRSVWLRKEGRPVILHPTGLTHRPEFGTFLGDTVNRKATIYLIDWERAWRDGNLDAAILDVCDDDVAVNGCRPEFVEVGGRTLLATADYGDVRPELRLLDPAALLAAHRTSAPGVVAHRILAGPWNQALHWVAGRGEVVCVENVIEGRGWRLDTINLAQAAVDGRVEGPGVRVGRVTFLPHDELEGFCWLDGGRGLFITSNRTGNLVVGRIESRGPRPSPPPASH